MLLKLRKILHNISDSFWFLPSLLVIFSIFLSFFFVYLDSIYFDIIRESGDWIFGGSPQAAQGILTAIIGALATIASIVYSIAIISLQQASSNYSPSIVRNFIHDRISQFVLGSYVSTIIYALLVLRTIRTEETGSVFVPAFSLMAAILFAATDLVLLVYFISHIIRSFQAPKIINNIYKTLKHQIKDLFPEKIGNRAEEPEIANQFMKKYEKVTSVSEVKSTVSGFIQKYDELALKNVKSNDIRVIFFPNQVGDFIGEGEVVAKLYGIKNLTREIVNKVRDIISIEIDRSEEEDILLPIRQLKDIVIKTIESDPTTAKLCIEYLSVALSDLAAREFPETKRQLQGSNILCVFSRPDWKQLLTKSFSQIRKKTSTNAHNSVVPDLAIAR